jgi:hypothetical protein
MNIYYDTFAAWPYSGGEPERALTRGAMLDDIALCWLTNAGTSSSQSYWEVRGRSSFNAGWEETLLEWIAEAQLIAVAVGRGRGLMWGLARVAEVGSTARVLLSFRRRQGPPGQAYED